MARRRLPGWVLGEQTVRREQRPRSKTARFGHNSTAYFVYAAELNLGNVELNCAATSPRLGDYSLENAIAGRRRLGPIAYPWIDPPRNSPHY